MVVYDENGAIVGSEFSLTPDLALNTKSLLLTLSSGVGSVPIPDNAKIIRVKPIASTAVRVGLEAPEADGTATGTAVAADLKKGCPCDVSIWTDFNIGVGTSRVLYLKGGTSDVVEVVVM
jgi:hypothetical protein